MYKKQFHSYIISHCDMIHIILSNNRSYLSLRAFQLTSTISSGFTVLPWALHSFRALTCQKDTYNLHPNSMCDAVPVTYTGGKRVNPPYWPIFEFSRKVFLSNQVQSSFFITSCLYHQKSYRFTLLPPHMSRTITFRNP